MKQVSTLRDILGGKHIPVFLVAMAMVVPGSVLAASPAAAVDSGVHIKESFGNYYIGAPTINIDDPVVETAGGRSFAILQSSGGGEKLAFTDGNETKCVAAANNGHDVVVHACDHDGTVWIEHHGAQPCPQTTCFESNKFSGLYLSGDNKGDQFQIKKANAAGWYQQFTVGA